MRIEKRYLNSEIVWWRCCGTLHLPFAIMLIGFLSTNFLISFCNSNQYLFDHELFTLMSLQWIVSMLLGYFFDFRWYFNEWNGNATCHNPYKYGLTSEQWKEREEEKKNSSNSMYLYWQRQTLEKPNELKDSSICAGITKRIVLFRLFILQHFSQLIDRKIHCHMHTSQ